MAKNNDVFQVLVTKGNSSVLGAGNKVTDLAVGQIGAFDANTNLSVSSLSGVRDFYLAVGLDTTGGSTLNDIAKSAGSLIQAKNIKYYSYRPHTASRPMKVVLSDYTANCATEYGLKLELRNQEIYRSQGYNQFMKTFSIVTACCEGCTPTCPSGDANEITKLLKANINNDPSGLITAKALARQALTILTHGVSADIAEGAEVSDANLLAIMAYNALQTDVANYVYTDLEVTTVTQAIADFSTVNLKYFYPRETIVIASKIEGFKCNGTLTVTQTAAFEEGSGYDVKQLEYMSKGWKESPYRLSSLDADLSTGYNAVATTKYDIIALTHDEVSQAAWLKYSHDEATIIAVPGPDTVTRNALMTLLDTGLTAQGFEALANDAAAANVDPAVVETTTAKTITTDGLS